MNTGQHSRGNRLYVAFDAADLSRKENPRMHAHLLRRVQQGGRVDVGVAVDLPKAEKARIFESWNQAQDPGLLAVFQVILESHQIVGIGAQVLLPKLDDRVRRLAGSGVFEADRLHGSEAEGVA